jgi:hypothetical protein
MTMNDQQRNGLAAEMFTAIPKKLAEENAVEVMEAVNTVDIGKFVPAVMHDLLKTPAITRNVCLIHGTQAVNSHPAGPAPAPIMFSAIACVKDYVLMLCRKNKRAGKLRGRPTVEIVDMIDPRAHEPSVITTYNEFIAGLPEEVAELARLLQDGLTDKEIRTQLGITRHTLDKRRNALKARAVALL